MGCSPQGHEELATTEATYRALTHTHTHTHTHTLLSTDQYWLKPAILALKWTDLDP